MIYERYRYKNVFWEWRRSHGIYAVSYTHLEKIDKIKPAYDITYKVVLFVCKLLLIADILITSMAVAGRYISFIPDPAWSEEIVLTCMSYMAVLSAALAIRRGAHIRMTAPVSYTHLDVYKRQPFFKSLSK